MDKNDEKAPQATRKIGYFGQNPDFRFWILAVAKIPPLVNHRSETRGEFSLEIGLIFQKIRRQMKDKWF